MGMHFKDRIYRDQLFTSFKGLDTASAITNMEPGYLRIARNVDITEEGAVTTRKGTTGLLDFTWAAGYSITAGLEYFNTTSLSRIMLFANDGLNGFFGNYNGSGVTLIASGLSTNRPSMVQINGLLFFFNGVNCFLYAISPLRQIGITPPVAAPTDNANIAGGLVIGASYIWAYTYYNSTTGAESSPSPVSSSIIIGAGGGRRINVTPGTATTANQIRVYRTTANGAILFLDGTTAITSTTYDSTVVDAGLGDELEIDNTLVTTYGQPKYAIVTQNRVAVTGFSANPNRVHFSKIGKSGPMPESFQVNAFADCISTGGLGDINIGLAQSNDVCIVLKQNSLGRIDQVGSINSEIGVDNVIFEYREISRAFSCVSHWATTNVYNNLVFLAKDNIYITDGKDVTPIASRIRDYFKTIANLDNPDLFSAENDTVNKRIIFAIKKGSLYEQLVGSYVKYPEFYWTIYSPGEPVADYPGINSLCLFSRQLSGQKEILAGTIDGQVLRLGQGLRDYLDATGTAPIDWAFRDYPTDFQIPEENKLFFKDFIHVRPERDDRYNINVGSVYDLSNQVENEFSIPLNTEGAIWDVSLWDVGVFQNPDIRRYYSKHRKALYCQLQFYSNVFDTPATIYGYIKAARPQEFK